MIRILLLSLLLFASATLWAYESEITVTQAYDGLSQGKLVLVDVRSPQEWQQTGVAPGALTISLHQSKGLQGISEALLKQLDGDKQAPIALICAGGVRSHRVQRYLLEQGFTQVSNVKEGMIGNWFMSGWIEQGLPIKSYLNQ